MKESKQKKTQAKQGVAGIRIEAKDTSTGVSAKKASTRIEAKEKQIIKAQAKQYRRKKW